MKKAYESPLFEFESYELDEFVASCAKSGKNPIESDDGFGTIFSDRVCDFTPTVPEDNDGYCYHIPTPGMQYFGS